MISAAILENMKIVIADDHRVVRQGIRWLLEDEPDFEVVGEAADGFEAVKKVADLRPDVLITDIKMPGLDGVEVTRQTTEALPGLRVIVVSMYGNKAYVERAMDAGASAYILKKFSNGNIVEAVRLVMQGKKYFSPGLAGTISLN